MGDVAEQRCEVHADVTAFAPCTRCQRVLCNQCLPHLVEGAIACTACANVARAHGGRPWGFAAMVLLTGGAISLALVRMETKGGGDPSYALYGMAGAVILAIAGFIVSRKRKGERVEDRSEEEMASVVEDPAGSPYRMAARRRLIPRVPPLSGRLTALALVLCFAFTGLSAPFALHMPKWLEAELVLSAWWLTWAVALGVLLYRGTRLEDDHRFSPSFWFGGKKKDGGSKSGKKKGKSSSSSGGWSIGTSIGDVGSVDGEGCVYLIGAIIVAGLAVLTAWLLVELVVPAVFTLAYMLLIRALTRVTNDQHECKGNALRSLGFGALWATVYVVPLSAIVLIVHEIVKRRGG